MAKILAPSAVVCAIACRYGLTPQWVFTWPRQAREPADGQSELEALMFVPAAVEAAPSVGRQRRLADHLIRVDFVILDEASYLPFA